MSLATVDMDAVEILDAGVTIHGRGSPPGGDRYSVDDLRAIAAANRELASELRPPAKIGHGDYGPAVGRLENLRVVGSKLVTDVKDVPRRFAELINSKAFNARSVELSRVTSQRTGKRYPLVVSALAWLGDRLPAVRTLADVEALYQGEQELVRAYEFAPPADTETLIDEAIAAGRIAIGSERSWQRMFELEPDAAAGLLESRVPDQRRRIQNRVARLNARPADLSDELVRAHEMDLASQLGVSIEELL